MASDPPTTPDRPDDAPLAGVSSHNPAYRHPRVATIVVLALGLAVTAVGTWLDHANTRRIDEQHFDRLVDRLRSEVSRRVMVYRYGLVGARSVFTASENVSADEFRTMVESRGLANEFPGSLGIGYIARVEDDQDAVDAFVAACHADGVTDFAITVPPGAAPLPGSAVDGRLIIQHIEPIAVNRTARGLDIGAHPVRREAAERAVLMDEASITGTIGLVQDNQSVAGFLYLLPVYGKGMPTETTEQRAEAVQGWVYMPLLGPSVFEGTAATTDHELGFTVFDGAVLTDANVIYDAVASHDAAGSALGGMDVTRTIEVGGRPWTLSIHTTDRFEYASRLSVVLLAVGGTALSLMLATLVYTLSTGTRRAWAIAEGMTADLRTYARRAEQATRAKSDFLANMSHEIRTPMTAILGYTELLESPADIDPDTTREYAATIRRNGRHLIAIINDILDLSKIEAGKMEVEHITTSTIGVVCEVLSLMLVQATAKGLTLTAEVATPIPESILCDPVRLRQVLVNLVGNAIKFTEVGGVTIRLRHEPEHGLFAIDVVDTGCGISDDQKARLFDAFEQADGSTTRRFGGSGLGLHISHRLTRMLGGGVSVRSEVGSGSRFTATVGTGPIGDAPTVEPGEIEVVHTQTRPWDSTEVGSPPPQLDPLTPERADQSEANARPLAGLRVLLVEDGIDNQRLINLHLTKAGAAVTIEPNGQRAIDALTAVEGDKAALIDPAPFDLVISDMQMPVMDGYTAVRHLRDLGCDLPIVALTAHAMSGDAVKCLAAGCDDVAVKPIGRDSLIEVCRKNTGASRPQRADAA